MSHAKERHEKICLNCNADLIGRFCQNCGQENIEPHETVWSLVHHFFADITHFDGKFFSTLKYLITKPGFLPKEYISGRRARYLHPIRMYVFTSAIFFLVFFSMINLDKGNKENKITQVIANTEQKVWDESRKKILENKNLNASDSAEIEDAYKAIMKVRKVVADSTRAKHKKQGLEIEDDEGWGFFSDKFFPSREYYDSVQASLPADERDGWFARQIAYRNIHVKEKFPDKREFWIAVINKFVHTLPYLLFVSLPLYALFLKLLYIRRKNFLYVDHAMFLIYLYIFTFIFILVQIGLNELSDMKYLNWLEIVIGLLFLAGFYYTYKAMRVFYGQGRFKTIVKFLTLNFMCIISLAFLFAIFLFFAIFRI